MFICYIGGAAAAAVVVVCCCCCLCNTYTQTWPEKNENRYAIAFGEHLKHGKSTPTLSTNIDRKPNTMAQKRQHRMCVWWILSAFQRSPDTCARVCVCVSVYWRTWMAVWHAHYQRTHRYHDFSHLNESENHCCCCSMYQIYIYLCVYFILLVIYVQQQGGSGSSGGGVMDLDCLVLCVLKHR